MIAYAEFKVHYEIYKNKKIIIKKQMQTFAKETLSLHIKIQNNADIS